MIGRMLSRLACWARRDYPEWASRRGHIALLALYGRPIPPLETTPQGSDY
jgi:hypothetical protein